MTRSILCGTSYNQKALPTFAILATFCTPTQFNLILMCRFLRNCVNLHTISILTPYHIHLKHKTLVPCEHIVFVFRRTPTFSNLVRIYLAPNINTPARQTSEVLLKKPHDHPQ